MAGFDESEAEIAAALAGWETPWFEASIVSERGDRIVAFLGAELDATLGRVWLYGPLVDHPDWDALADGLLAALTARAPGVLDKDQELTGDVRNIRLDRFALRHGFVAGAVHDVLSLDARGLRRLPTASVPPVEPEHEDAFVALHERLFPGTYYSGRQLLDQSSRDRAVVRGLVDDGDLAGYVAGRIDEGGDGYVDFVGVDPERRRQGHGRTLIAAVAHTLDARGPIGRVRLTVSRENVAAQQLYDELGFVRAPSAVGYRRRPESAD